jgi:Tol biopolymer transport system component
MTPLRIAGLVVAWTLVPACFDPSYHAPRCALDGACPPGKQCNALQLCDDIGPPTDAVADAVADSAADGSIGCFARWLDGTVAFAMPQALPNQSMAGDEHDPWISSDGFTLYYALGTPGASSGADIYIASRAASSLPFGGGSLIDALSTSGDDFRPSLTADQQLLVLSNDQHGQFDVFLSVRTSMSFGKPDTRHLDAVNTAATDHYDPFLSSDGLRLYLAPSPRGGAQHIAMATRADRDSDFGAAEPVRVINDAQSGDADPALSLDERVIVFTSSRPTGMASTGGTNLWYATRQDPTQDFGLPEPIPMVNSDRDDGDPMLSADGCELYFTSNQLDVNNHDLYVARIPH